MVRKHGSRLAVEESVGQHLLETKADHAIPHGHGRARGLWPGDHLECSHWRPRGYRLKANDPGHLLDEILFNGEVESMAGRGHLKEIVCGTRRVSKAQSQSSKDSRDLIYRIGSADDAFAPTPSHRDWVSRRKLKDLVDNGPRRATADLDDQRTDALEVHSSTGRINTPLKAMPCIGGKFVTLCSATNGIGPPEGGL